MAGVPADVGDRPRGGAATEPKAAVGDHLQFGGAAQRVRDWAEDAQPGRAAVHTSDIGIGAETDFGEPTAWL